MVLVKGGRKTSPQRLKSGRFYGMLQVYIFTEKEVLTMMVKGRTMLAASKQAKHSPALFPCQGQNRIFFKAHSARFHTGGVRLFALSCGRRKKFLPDIYCPVNQDLEGGSL